MGCFMFTFFKINPANYLFHTAQNLLLLLALLEKQALEINIHLASLKARTLPSTAG